MPAARRSLTDNVVFQTVGFEPDGEFDSVGSPSFISHTVGNGTVHPVPGRSRDQRELEPGSARSAVPVPGRRRDSRCRSSRARPGWRWCRRRLATSSDRRAS